MYPANNPNYSFPWGLPPSNQNVNPFAPPNLFDINFAEGTHVSNRNEDFAFQPSPWNNFNPQPPANRWNHWIPSSEPRTTQRPPDPLTQPLLSSCDLRNRLLKTRQQRQEGKKPIKNSVTTNPKPQPKQHAAASSDTTIKLSLFRSYTIPPGTNPPSVNKKVRPHFLALKELLPKFMLKPSSSLFGDLVKKLIFCSKNVSYIEEIQKFLQATLSNDAEQWFTSNGYTAPHLRMRVFWLLGEIFRPDYDKYFGKVRRILKADELFQEFLRKYTVKSDFINELQAIWYYWKSYVPKNVLDMIASTSLNVNRKHLVNSTPNHSGLLENYGKIFGNATLSPTSNVNVQPRQRPTPIVFDIGNDSRSSEKMILEAPKKKVPNANSIPLGQKRNEIAQIQENQVVTHNYSWPWPAKFSLPITTSITASKPNPVSQVKTQESFNIDTKITKFLSLLDKLITVDRNDVTKAASELLYCFLEHGSDNHLSDRIVKETTKRFQEVCNNIKIIRVLWVIGYLFFPKYESKLTALKPLVEKIAARLFWICLSKTHKDTSTREEMRVILKLWREIVPEEIASSVMARINDTIASDPDVKLNWILNDKNIRKGTRIVDYYSNKYLMTASTAGPKSKAKERKSTSVEDSDDEIIILDKCDVIQPPTTNQQKNREDKRAVKHTRSDESLDSRHKLMKRTKVAEEETDNIFTEFHRIPCKPVNLVKPVLRKESITTDDSPTFNSTVHGESCVSGSGNSGSGNQEQQQSGGLSKLELFRRKMEKDAAIASIGGPNRWNDTTFEKETPPLDFFSKDTTLKDNKEIYLRKAWAIDEFVYCVCSEEFQTSWDIVKLDGELRVKIFRK